MTFLVILLYRLASATWFPTIIGPLISLTGPLATAIIAWRALALNTRKHREDRDLALRREIYSHASEVNSELGVAIGTVLEPEGRLEDLQKAYQHYAGSVGKLMTVGGAGTVDVTIRMRRVVETAYIDIIRRKRELMDGVNRISAHVKRREALFLQLQALQSERSSLVDKCLTPNERNVVEERFGPQIHKIASDLGQEEDLREQWSLICQESFVAGLRSLRDHLSRLGPTGIEFLVELRTDLGVKTDEALVQGLKSSLERSLQFVVERTVIEDAQLERDKAERKRKLGIEPS